MRPAPIAALAGLVTSCLELLYPAHCPACDHRLARAQPLCERCAVSLYELGPACPRCSAPTSEPPSRLCARCRRASPPYSRLIAPYLYGGELAVALKRLKYDRRPDIARALGPLLAPALARAAAEVDLAIPIPLHRRRLAERGFNQAALLLRHAARGAPIRQDRLSLRRPIDTRPQSGLGASERARNLARAFAVPPRRAGRVRGRRVLLVDDVVTTGATIAAAASALLAAGAAEVIGLCAARAEGPS